MIEDYYCKCVVGFTGRICFVNIDDCLYELCQYNGSRCVDGVNGFICVCFFGYIGLNCFVEINECVFLFCFNNGSCIDEMVDFQCNCLLGFKGQILFFLSIF